MPLGCPEKLGLERNLAVALSAVYKLKDEAHDNGNVATSVWLDQARTAQRDAERALHEHLKEHGCERLK